METTQKSERQSEHWATDHLKDSHVVGMRVQRRREARRELRESAEGALRVVAPDVRAHVNLIFCRRIVVQPSGEHARR